MTHRNCGDHWDTLHIETRYPYKFVKQSHVYMQSRYAYYISPMKEMSDCNTSLVTALLINGSFLLN